MKINFEWNSHKIDVFITMVGFGPNVFFFVVVVILNNKNLKIIIVRIIFSCKTKSEIFFFLLFDIFDAFSKLFLALSFVWHSAGLLILQIYHFSNYYLFTSWLIVLKYHNLASKNNVYVHVQVSLSLTLCWQKCSNQVNALYISARKSSCIFIFDIISNSVKI